MSLRALKPLPGYCQAHNQVCSLIVNLMFLSLACFKHAEGATKSHLAGSVILPEAINGGLNMLESDCVSG